MDTLPISTLPTPPAPTGAESPADAGAAADTPDGGFQAALVRSLTGNAQGVTSTSAASQDAIREEEAAMTEDALATLPEGALSASDSALALLAALPQQATPADTPSPGAGVGSAAGEAVDGGIAIPIDTRTGGPSAAAAQRADDPALPGKGMASLRPGDGGSLAPVDPERPGEAARGGMASIGDLNASGTQQAAQAAYAHNSLLAPDTAASAPAPVAQPRIDTPLGAPGWSTALAEQLIVFAAEKQQVAELRINPPHLGPVDITLTVSDDQASAVFASPHAVVRETIESALPRLREVLAESGINLGQASVTADSPRDGSAQAQARAGFSAGRERPGADAVQPATAARATPGRGLPGLVDLFA
jgi:flagellar hook-length control protein FliK